METMAILPSPTRTFSACISIFFVISHVISLPVHGSIAAGGANSFIQKSDSDIVLQNSHVYMVFSGSQPGFPLSYLSSSPSSYNLVIGNPVEPLWRLHVVDDIGEIIVDAVSAEAQQSHTNIGHNAFMLTWRNIPVKRASTNVTTLDVVLNVSLPEDSPISLWVVGVVNHNPGARIGLWQITISTSGLTAGTDDTVFFPYGFGITVPASSSAADRDSLYPGSSASMQFMAVGGGVDANGTGVYFGIHDPRGSVKHLRTSVNLGGSDFAPASSSSSSPSSSSTSSSSAFTPNSSANISTLMALSALFESNNPFLKAHRPSPLPHAASPSTTLATDILIPNAGLPFSSYTMDYPIAVGVISQTPTWYGAAQLYRTWALNNALWSRAGPIAKRSDIPQWFQENNVWVNSGWQCRDIFNDTQGDPFVVQERLTNIRRLMNMSLALHWYEWQQGPDPLARYRFDTHYPDYFPPRAGFKTAVEALQKMGVYVFPYINGRIFDVESLSYIQDKGGQYCSQNADVRYNADDLTLYEESYGSGATFNVGDPTTTYWQSKIAGAC